MNIFTFDNRAPDSLRDSFPDALLKLPESEPSVTSHLLFYDWALSYIPTPNPYNTPQLDFLSAFQTRAQSYSHRPAESFL